MDFNLSKEHLALQTKAKEFTEQVLFPHELECEENDGISKETHEEIKKQVVEWGFNAPNHSREDGGQEFSIFEQTLLNEQLGMATGAIWDALWYPSYPMKYASQEQKERYLIPTCQGKRRDAYAITEADAGSDPRQCATRADRVDGGWIINGEKWFVTLGDIADYILVHAHVDGDPDKPTVFFVDKDLPGVEVKRTPLYTHHFAFEHPEFVFKDVFLTDKEMLGEVGQGYELTKDWFVEARLGIAARCVGGAIRAAEEANQFVAGRQQFGQPLRDFQAIEFMLADMAVKIMAAKSMLYRLSWEIDQSDDRKMKHARAAALKLHCSEMVGQVCDTALQIMGGRGYMREQPVERLWRDTRVDRIWEGTSEIQRVIIAGQIKKRGLGVYTNW
ncbi:acyl-CoA dehydrogenase family protein [Vibrio nigripulchritudo]|uniref:acyl-CoA dehydrogenase family protein n=1 Tax=Vibrio nigripulchritudo TaxID=28173 RepID=UPI0005F9D593|nr:acyl-CoA dehydrogenase family protein [Vibrio nigripulchritudo]KJY78345.1 acyl-CoA dehydrogenase [Vibrio nigripulchritudo]